ncbi:O-antigen ligase [Alcanivorax sp. HI0044]|uniref:O-antigen ligase family protein n=2 Tax=unclassified Alcanivorax TaxID=2638842 RepID=UPI0012E8647F|nr:O-antigen ligase family protein [Alcanivorax sp. HI0044]
MLAVGMALLCLAACQREAGRLAADDIAILLVLMVFSLLWLADVWRAGQWPVGAGGEGRWLPVWPLFAGLVLLAWRRVPPSPMVWWWGVAVGALFAGGIAAYEHFWLGRWRPDNGMNAIPFGNIALLLGTLSLVALVSLRGERAGRLGVWQKALLVLAALAGLLASVLSGTRGGWVVFPTLALLVCVAAFVSLPRRRMVALVAILMATLLAMAFLPRASVTARVGEGVENLQRYTQGEAGSSLGLRLEMWRAGWLLIQHKPLLGWGEGKLESQRDLWVAEGRFNRGVSRYDQLHSDTVDTFARRGVVGLVSLLALYLLPLGLFCRYWYRGVKARNREVQAFALSGALVVVAFMGFGLSQSMLRDPRGLAGFLGLLVACWCLLKRAAESQAYVGLRPSTSLCPWVNTTYEWMVCFVVCRYRLSQ